MESADAQVSAGSGGAHTVLEVDFQALYEGIKETGGRGLTTQEIRQKTGWGERKARAFIKKALLSGLCVMEKKTTDDTIDGRAATVPSYVFK